MRITDFKVLRANRAVYCKIYTDEGIVGLGERCMGIFGSFCPGDDYHVRIFDWKESAGY